LFEIASHTYSHRALRDNIFCGPEISDDDKIVEINRSKQIIENIMERPCLGLRPAFALMKGSEGNLTHLG
jgi:peptidoglycan/xylan/chitin deacetylase (PgdA/CDA1 family)